MIFLFIRYLFILNIYFVICHISLLIFTLSISLNHTLILSSLIKQLNYYHNTSHSSKWVGLQISWSMILGIILALPQNFFPCSMNRIAQFDDKSYQMHGLIMNDRFKSVFPYLDKHVTQSLERSWRSFKLNHVKEIMRACFVDWGT